MRGAFENIWCQIKAAWLEMIRLEIFRKGTRGRKGVERGCKITFKYLDLRAEVEYPLRKWSMKVKICDEGVKDFLVTFL